MAFWDLFKTAEIGNDYSSNLHKKLADLLPGKNEEELTKIACISGIFSRIILADMTIEDDEITSMKSSLKSWTSLDQKEIDTITKIAVEEVKNLAGIENHKYCGPLNELLDKNERHQLLIALFGLAASDGNACHNETEEIRLLTKSLLLDHRYFISARATVLDKLGILNNKD
ncbi:MAG: TerB family tellurite resistance protein [Bdellovibrionales bacterium]|jgi:uncharacterized tellurite resistance protein B-like protein|nr:TerB family tellurite resistance protein [Bdellovibrionales bacterium]